jgi:DNA primase
MEHEHFTYPEALRYLAKKYNIEIEEKQMTKKQVDANNEKSSLFLVNEFARDFFIKNLNDNSEGNKIGLSYLLERGISNEMINLFEIGYALENNNNLSTEIISNSFDKDLVVKSGLSKEKGEQAPLPLTTWHFQTLHLKIRSCKTVLDPLHRHSLQLLDHTLVIDV